jgi:snoRNA binding domain, fibrillarin
VARAVVLERGGELVLILPPPAGPLAFPLSSGLGSVATPERIPPGFLAAVRSLAPGTVVHTDSDRLASELSPRLERTVTPASISELRHARGVLPPPLLAEERRFALATARDALERALRTPEEILITLTREEERVERAVGREARAAESFLVVPGSSLSEYAGHWTRLRDSLERHHERLLDQVRDHARRVVPNLAAVVGERAAARLVSAAGSVNALGQMRAGRIQLLGTRRRPSPERGPRYGILYRAEGMADVPPGRRGAYARSLGAIAAIAVRADATTRSSISKGLVARRDRRIEQLQRRKA